MNKIVSIRTVALLLAALPLIALAQRGSVSYTATYDIGRLSIGTTVQDGVTYSTVDYDGLFNNTEPGNASLPVDYIRFSVPYNAGNFTVTATASVTNTVELDYPADICPHEADNASECPVQTAWYVDEGMLAGENHIVTVAVAPVACETGNLLKFNGTVTVTLSYELSDTPRLTPIIRRGAALRTKGQERAQSMVVNPSDVVANAASTRMGVNRDDELTDPETYLIVTTEDMVHPLRRLAALKRQKGIPVKVVTMTDVVNDPVASQGDIIVMGGDTLSSFVDDAGKLHRYLRIQWEDRGTEFVLLAGEDVPNRHQSDLYFSTFWGDWPADIDNYPEINAGRLLGSEEIQFDNYTDKLFRYELNPGKGNYTYLRRAMYTEGYDYVTYLGDVNGTLQYLFPEDTLINVDESGYFTGSDVVDFIGGFHPAFWFSMNDGTPTYLKIYGEDEFGVSHYIWAIDTARVAPDVTDSETGNALNVVQNKDYPMISYNLLGQTMPYTTVNGYDVDVNYGESFTMGKDYGGPVYIGNTSDVNYYHARVHAAFFSNQLSLGTSVLGQAFSDSKWFMPPKVYDQVLRAVNYLGDPALDMWTGTPQTYTGISLSRSNNSVTITGVPTYTTVSYYSNDGTTGSLNASSSTVTLNGVSPNSSIMLYRHNRIPYIAPLVLQNVTLNNSQYVIAGSVLAGNKVDSNRTYGQVTVSNNVEYEIEAAGEVKIAGGFKVEKGAYFSITPASY